MALDDHADRTDEPDEPTGDDNDTERREEAVERRKPLEIPKGLAVTAAAFGAAMNIVGEASGEIAGMKASMERPKAGQPAPSEWKGPVVVQSGGRDYTIEIPEPAEKVKFGSETEGKLTEDEPDDEDQGDSPDERADMEIRDEADQAEDLVDQDVDDTDAVDDDPETRPWDDSDASSLDDADLGDDPETRPDDYSAVPADRSGEPMAGLETTISTVPMRRDIRPDLDDQPALPDLTEPPPSGGDTDDQIEVGEIPLPGD